MAKNKKRISKLLDEDRGWHNIKDKLPDADKHVIIRMTNPHYIYYETDVEIYYAEDLKIAKCVKDYNDPDNIDKCTWSIIPPYPKFDYSPLSRYDRLLEGTVVTHWADVSDEDIESWNNRFNITDAYLTLRFDIDDDHAELMYKALMYGAGVIGRAYTQEKSDELLAYHVMLQDLLNSMDKNVMIENGKEISKQNDYDPANEDNSVDEELVQVIKSATKEPADLKAYKIDIVEKLSKLVDNANKHIIADNAYFGKDTFNTLMSKVFTDIIGIDLKSVPCYSNFEGNMNKPEE